MSVWIRASIDLRVPILTGGSAFEESVEAILSQVSICADVYCF